MSVHLKGGAPAFSPNNMRVGVDGMKKVVKKQKNNKTNKEKKSKKMEGEKGVGEKEGKMVSYDEDYGDLFDE